MAMTRGGNKAGGYNPEGIEVPFLVNNNQKWISGIVEETTCGDVVKALLAAEGRLKGIDEQQLDKFVMVERWRRVERPLKKESCLLKIWQAWGKEAKDVQFILKRVSSKKVSRPRTKVKRSNSKLIKQLADFEQKHPKYAGSDSDSEVVHMQGNIQALLKIIISQRETIQTQLGNLKAKDMYLKTLDKSLSCSDGREYVLRNYLEQIPEHVEETLEESQDSGCGSGNDTQDSCNEANTPDHTADSGLIVNENPAYGDHKSEVSHISGDKSVDVMQDLFEKLFHLNKKLEVQEDDIFRLTVQMEAMLAAKDSNVQSMTLEQENILHNELQIAQEELDTMAKLNSRLGYEIKRNELALTNMMKNYDGRKQFAKRLEEDVNQAESSVSTAKCLNRIEEETDWEDSNDESDDEEIKAGTQRMEQDQKEMFPVLAPPEQFQNCLSPSATYEGPGRMSVASPAYSNDSVSSTMTSSTATEKSVRFSDRDLILSTPEPRGPACWPFRSDLPEQPRHDKPELLTIKVKSILKSEPYPKNYGGGPAIPDVTSFLLDREDGTLV